MSKTIKNTDTSTGARKLALDILLSVIKDGQSLSSLNSLGDSLEPRDAAFARMLSFGVLRFYQQLQALLQPLMAKPLKKKELDIQLIILLAFFQILHTRVPDYAVVDAAVKQVRKSRKKWAASMVNGVLRNFLRQLEKNDPPALIEKLNNEEAIFSHPQWIINRLQQDWPDNWQAILQQNNNQAPMTLRINQQKTNTGHYLQLLENNIESGAAKIEHIPAALILDQPQDVTGLPGFEDGWVSVQDAGAQLAAQILQPEAGDEILDACAAPGGKTAHLYEMQADIKMTALDISADRLQRVNENCQRLGFNPQLIVADATDVDSWWQGKQFDKILLDVPCSAVGVIRRHPDIKHLRREEDIEVLVALQRKILVKNWTVLKPGGVLLYATCSVFKAENEQQVSWFLKNTSDAEAVSLAEGILKMPGVVAAETGVQLFPQADSHDGFYYALLKKTTE